MDLNEYLKNLGSDFGASLQKSISETTQKTVNMGLDELSKTSAGTGSGWWDQFMGSVTKGVKSSNLGIAADTVAWFKNPWVIVGGSLLFIILIAKLMRK